MSCCAAGTTEPYYQPGLVAVGGGCGAPNHGLKHILPGLLHDSSLKPRVGLMSVPRGASRGKRGASAHLPGNVGAWQLFHEHLGPTLSGCLIEGLDAS